METLSVILVVFFLACAMIVALILWQKMDDTLQQCKVAQGMLLATTPIVESAPPTSLITETGAIADGVPRYEADGAIRTEPSTIRYDSSSYRRDKRVVVDQLYPPYNREPLEVYDSYTAAQQIGLFDYSTRGGPSDAFRLCAYLVGDRDQWKLFGRQQQSGSSLGEFYAIPTDKLNDIKIFLTRDIVAGNQRLNDIYNLPDTISFTSPIFKSAVYTVSELPKTDYRSQYT